MGWAKRWMKALLRSKKDVRDRRDAASYSGGEERRDRKNRSFARPRQASAVDGALTPANAPEQAGSQRTCYANNSEDSERAIAVAMATAAAADTAVIAAHAAMARLQCLAHGRTVTILWAAINIQKAYRGYLARKALRALKALVKLQALIRGQIVRKQAAATLKQLEALVRVQAFSLHRRSHHFPEEGRRRMRQEYFPRRSFEKASACEARIKYLAAAQSQGSDRSPKVVEVDTCQHQSRSFHATSSYMLHQHEELKQISSPRKLNLTLRQIRCSQDFDCHDADSVKGRYPKTTQNTPRLPSANLTESPRATDDILERLLNRTDYPSYMASTRSFAAKVRSHSMAKAGLETPRLKNRIASGQMIESSASLIGNGTGRNLKVGGEGRLDKSLDLCSEAARDYYLDTMW